MEESDAELSEFYDKKCLYSSILIPWKFGQSTPQYLYPVFQDMHVLLSDV